MTAPTIISDEAGRQRILDQIAHLDLEGKPWEITVKRHRKRRSNAQGRLYFGWVEEVVKHVVEYTGYEKDEIHDYFKSNFLEPGKEIQIKGLPARRRSPTTTTLDTKQMAEYCDRIYRWASVELGLALRLPPVRGYDSDGHAVDTGPPQQANGADDDWHTIATDIMNLIADARDLDRLEEITALYEDDLTAMEASAPPHYTRVMRAMERQGEDLNRAVGLTP